MKNGLKAQRNNENGRVENKVPLLKFTNYHSLTALVDRIYAVTDKNLYKQLDTMKGERSWRDVKENCAFQKHIGHSTKRCMAFKDEIKRLIRAGHFKEFLDEPQATNRDERPRQQIPERVREVLTTIDRPHVAKESHSAHDMYAKEAKTLPKYMC